MKKFSAKEVRSLLLKNVETGNFFFDGEEAGFENQFRFNGKTMRFVEQNGIDEAIDILLQVLSEGSYWGPREGQNIYEEETSHIYKLWNESLSSRVYVKATFRRDGIPVVACHD